MIFKNSNVRKEFRKGETYFKEFFMMLSVQFCIKWSLPVQNAGSARAPDRCFFKFLLKRKPHRNI